MGSTFPEPTNWCRELGCLKTDVSRLRDRRQSSSAFASLPTISLNKPSIWILETSSCSHSSSLSQDLSTVLWSVQTGLAITITSLVMYSLFTCSRRVLLVGLSSFHTKIPTSFQKSLGLLAPHCVAYLAAGIEVPS